MFLSSIATAAVLVGGFHSPPPQPTIPPQATTSPATAEGVEILRRILTDAVDKAFDEPDRNVGFVDPVKPGALRFGGPEKNEIRGMVTSLWAADEPVSHSRAFHLPGRGVVFSLDVRLPTVKAEAKADDAPPEAPQDDEWNRVRRQVRGGDRTGIVYRTNVEPVRLEIDPAAVDRLTDTIVTTLGRHASRIEGLDPQATFTVAVHVSGGREAAWSHWNVISQDEDVEDPGSSFVLALGADVPEQHLVIELALADVRGAGQGGYGRLAERARVNRY